MASIHITQFGGLAPELDSRLKPIINAQIAHNCLLSDGTLRPQAKWIKVPISNGENSIVYDKISDAVFTYDTRDSVQMNGEPFLKGYVVGAATGWEQGVAMCAIGANNSIPAPITFDYLDGTIEYTRSFDSVKPVNRLYACTLVRKLGTRADESALRLLENQDPSAVLYEGDLVTINITGYSTASYITHVRIYRSISGLDTGENVTNALDTNWHLVDELPTQGGVITYIDGASATAIPLDVCYSQNFHVPAIGTRSKYFGLSESGWFVLGDENNVQISERYMYHAWPVDNHVQLPDVTIVDLTVDRDAVYLGTDREPYVIALAEGENGLQVTARPFPEAIPCLPGSLASTGSGAVYASGQGLVGLSPDGLRLLTREIANAGDILYAKTNTYIGNKVERITASIANTGYGAYHLGSYFGFCTIATYRESA